MTQTQIKVAVVLSLLFGAVGGRYIDAAAGATASGTAMVDGRTYPFSGTAECTYTADGSIYDVPAAIWHASLSPSGGAVSHVNATIFQTRTGAPQVTMTLTVGQRQYQVATVKGGASRGTAVAKGERNGAGGSLTIEGRTAAGQTIALTVACSGFAPPEDNG